MVRSSFQSEVLATSQPTQNYLVYVPPCFDRDAGRAYPVVYLLHGAQTDENQWADIGVAAAADRLITNAQIPPLLIVLTDAIWAMGAYEGNPQVVDMVLIDELMPVIERQYPTIRDRAHRAVGGISRGGEWALLVVGHHPEEFGTVGGHSPAVGPPTTPNNYIVPVVANNRAARIWLDDGEGDSLTGSVASFHQALDQAGIAHEYHSWPGGHDRAYWGSHLDDYLRFYSASWPAQS